MTQEDFICSLKERIHDYEYEKKELLMMISDWDNYFDSRCNPDAQHTQQEIVNNLFKEIFDFTLNNKEL
jgi:hypothetical protein